MATKFYIILSGQAGVLLEKKQVQNENDSKDNTFDFEEKETESQQNSVSQTDIINSPSKSKSPQKRKKELSIRQKCISKLGTMKDYEEFMKQSQNEDFIPTLPGLTWGDLKYPQYFFKNLHLDYFCANIIKKGESFGENGLLATNGIRTASIIALTDCDLIYLNQKQYNEMLKKIHHSKLQNKIEFFQNVMQAQLNIVNLMKLTLEINRKIKFSYNTVIFSQNQPIKDKSFVYLIKTGEVQITQNVEVEENIKEKNLPEQLQFENLQQYQKFILQNKKKKTTQNREICILGPGEFLGLEDIFNKKIKRSYTVKSLSNVKFYAITKKSLIIMCQEHSKILDCLKKRVQNFTSYIEKRGKIDQKHHITQIFDSGPQSPVSSSSGNYELKTHYIDEVVGNENVILSNKRFLKSSLNKQREQSSMEKEPQKIEVVGMDNRSEYMELLDTMPLYHPAQRIKKNKQFKENQNMKKEQMCLHTEGSSHKENINFISQPSPKNKKNGAHSAYNQYQSQVLKIQVQNSLENFKNFEKNQKQEEKNENEDQKGFKRVKMRLYSEKVPIKANVINILKKNFQNKQLKQPQNHNNNNAHQKSQQSNSPQNHLMSSLTQHTQMTDEQDLNEFFFKNRQEILKKRQEATNLSIENPLYQDESYHKTLHFKMVQHEKNHAHAEIFKPNKPKMDPEILKQCLLRRDEKSIKKKRAENFNKQNWFFDSFQYANNKISQQQEKQLKKDVKENLTQIDMGPRYMESFFEEQQQQQNGNMPLKNNIFHSSKMHASHNNYFYKSSHQSSKMGNLSQNQNQNQNQQGSDYYNNTVQSQQRRHLGSSRNSVSTANNEYEDGYQLKPQYTTNYQKFMKQNDQNNQKSLKNMISTTQENGKMTSSDNVIVNNSYRAYQQQIQDSLSQQISFRKQRQSIKGKVLSRGGLNNNSNIQNKSYQFLQQQQRNNTSNNYFNVSSVQFSHSTYTNKRPKTAKGY